MANKNNWLGMAIALVFGMTVIGCDNGSTNNPYDGIIFSNPFKRAELYYG